VLWSELAVGQLVIGLTGARGRIYFLDEEDDGSVFILWDNGNADSTYYHIANPGILIDTDDISERFTLLKDVPWTELKIGGTIIVFPWGKGTIVDLKGTGSIAFETGPQGSLVEWCRDHRCLYIAPT
jgi:hypothetical protein